MDVKGLNNANALVPGSKRALTVAFILLGLVAISACSTGSSGPAGDTTPPTIISVAPTANAANVPATSSISATFNEALATSSVNDTAFILKSGSSQISGNVAYNNATKTATFMPSTNLSYGTLYTATIAGMKDMALNALADTYQWNFTTENAPAAVPFAPIEVSAVAEDSQVTLSWHAVTGATSYNIYWSTESNVLAANGNKIPNAASPYVHTNRTNGTIYYYIVTAVNLFGESTASAPVSATPSPVPSAPASIAGKVLAEGYTDSSGNFAITAAVNGVSFIISGAVSYDDTRLDPVVGLYEKAKIPVRYAVVQVMGKTENSFYVRCLAQNDAKTFSVRDGQDNIYAFISAVNPIGSDTTVDLYAQDPNAEPFNIYDCILNGMLYTKQFTVLNSAAVLTVKWGKGLVGTYYQPASRILMLQGLDSDNDAWDDHVILHEFSHFIASTYSKDDSPGGIHYLSGSNDKRLAWSEGWATYYGLSIYAWTNQKNPDLQPQWYLDTTGQMGSANIAIAYEIETPSVPGLKNLPPTTFMGDSSEVSISAALWDMTDTPLPDDDNLSAPMTAIWGVFAKEMPKSANVTFENFRDGWYSLGYQTQYDLVPILTARTIEYWAEVQNANTPETAVAYSSADVLNGTTKHFTYFPAGDVDWVKFDAVANGTYTISTTNILGADTFLEVFYYSPLLTSTGFQNNDTATCTVDPVSQECRASAILFYTGTSAGTYYVKSHSFLYGISSYGSYDLSIKKHP